MIIDDEDRPKIPKRENWVILRERLKMLIKPGTWENATLIKEIFELMEVINKAYPELVFSIEDLRLALHDLNVPFERNEHNDKFYYLGMWM